MKEKPPQPRGFCSLTTGYLLSRCLAGILPWPPSRLAAAVNESAPITSKPRMTTFVRTTGAIAVTAAVLAIVSTAAAQTAPRPSLQAARLQAPPAIDGVLDDDAWRGEPQRTGDWLSYNPLHGSKIPQQTRVGFSTTQKPVSRSSARIRNRRASRPRRRRVGRCPAFA
jgi:hypothetical protein